MLKAGFDIGGTKCAVVIGREAADGSIEVLCRKSFATKNFRNPYKCLAEMCRLYGEMMKCLPGEKPLECIGISCGGPLDSMQGIVQSPPNLPGWDDIHVTDIVADLTGIKAKLENDANACALAEWKYGAGRGTRNMVFLTFGTGLGAGVILNGALYSGATGLAGECGHIRLAQAGPVGYGKAGSFEGFCSGGGIARLGQMRARKALAAGRPFAWAMNEEAISAITAKSIAQFADAGDLDAKKVYAESGRRLGQGLAMLIDILNPECIVIGSVFARAEHLLRPTMERMLHREALPEALRACRILPAQLGEAIGDIACLAIGSGSGRL